MGAENIGRLLDLERGLFVPGKGFIVRWGDFGATGGSAPSDTNYAKGCLLINFEGNANYNLWINEGSGFGSSPSWQAVST